VKNGFRSPFLLALVSSVLLFMAMPGYLGWWPLLAVALVPLLKVCLLSRPAAAWKAGWFAGLLYQVLTVHWLVVALVRYGHLPLWAGIGVMLLLSGYLALFQGAFCFLLSLLAGRFWHRERGVAALVWLAPVLWVGLDALRARLLTGFPWLDLGYGLYRVPQLIQAADLGGHYLITFSLVLVNGLVLAVWDRQRREVRWNIGRERRGLFMAWGFLIFVLGYSLLSWRMLPVLTGRGLRAQVAVIQGNIRQDRKWDARFKEATLQRYADLTRKAITGRPTELVVWPETALPFYPQADPLARELGRLVREWNVFLLTGAPTFTGQGTERRFYNSALLLDPRGVVRGVYAKQHLVPFGEYVPLRDLFSFLSPVVEAAGDFSPGRSAGPLDIGSGMRAGVLICFESIFPEIARNETAAGATLLVNLTNDAWYGRSSAPVQSLAMAVLRAVENRRAVVRAANTGISALIAPDGRILQASPIFVPDELRGEVPLLASRSVFTLSGHHFGLACLALIPVLFVFRHRFQ